MEKTCFSRRAEENSGIFTWSVEFSRNAAVAAEKWLWLTSFIYLYSHILSFVLVSLSVWPDLCFFFFFFAFRSWLHSACYQCDPAEGLWGWGDSWGKWWKVQSRLHQHRAPRLPQVPAPRPPPLLWRRLTWLMDVSEMFRVDILTSLCVFFLQGTEGQEEQSVGSHAAQQLSSPGRCAVLDHHQPQPAGPWQEEDLPTVVSTTQDMSRLQTDDIGQY